MGVENRIASLKKRHAEADALIKHLELQPRRNHQQIQSLKKQKLLCKDEIVRLENPARLTAPKKGKKKKRDVSMTDVKDTPTPAVNVVSISAQPAADISRAA